MSLANKQIDLPKWLGPVLAWRLLLLFFIYASVVLLPDFFDMERWEGHFRWHPGPAPNFGTLFTTWDSNHYLNLADVGYIAGAQSNAFYPLWPMLIRAFSPLFGGNLLASSVVLANAFAVGGALVLHRLTKRKLGEDTADSALLLYLAFPGAFFLGLPYSEALFMLLLLLCFDALDQGKEGRAAIFAILLPIARPQGLFLGLPLLVHAVLRKREKRLELRDALVAAPALGFALYLGLMWVWTGNPMEGFDAQERFVMKSSVARLFDPIAFFSFFFGAAESLHGFTTSKLDRFWFILCLASLPTLWKLDKRWFAWALVASVIPCVTLPIASFSRYALAVFPLFIAGAHLLRNRRQWLAPTLMFLGGIQLFFLIRHINNRWAG